MKNILAKVSDEVKAAAIEQLAPDVEGMTSPRVRMLLNRLVAELPADEAYLEVGCFKGATFISALLGHTQATAYGVDNWSQFKDHDAGAYFRANTDKYKKELPPFNFIEADFFKLSEYPFTKPIGLYFYDGHHGEASQRAAIELTPRFLAKQAIIVIDDWNQDGVRRGTWAGIADLRLKAVVFKELPTIPDGFYRGIGAFYVERG